MLEIRLLGRVCAVSGDREIDTGHTRQRRLLAVLALELGRVLPIERLVETLWDGEPPRSARNIVAGHAARLRKTLAQSAAESSAGEPAPVLSSSNGGYVLHMDPAAVDLYRFKDLVSLAGGTAQEQERAETLRQALGLWRGPALDGVTCASLQPVCVGLEQQRVDATLMCCDAELRLGRHRELVPELLELADARPYDEHVALRLIKAHNGSGNPAAAIERYKRLQGMLMEELGTAPSPELREAGRRLLRGFDPGPAAGAAPTSQAPYGAAPSPDSAPAEQWQAARMPRRPGQLVGRDGELRELDGLAGAQSPDSDTEPREPFNLLVVNGIPGSGKTALAVHWAHRVRDRFPDGQFYVNLRCHDPQLQPLSPADALGRCLFAFRLSAADLPAGLEERAALYRSLLADRKVLIVLDDVADTEQVRHLLPPRHVGSAVVMTCRHQLPELSTRYGAHQLTLGVLGENFAVDLLGTLVGTRRVHSEPQAAARLAQACGHLPLALSIAAADLLNRPGVRLAEVVSALVGTGSDPDAGMPGEIHDVVRRVFDLSYQRLPVRARRIFRYVGLIPGADFSTDAVVAMAGDPAAETERALDTLVRANLVSEYASHRFRLHDLVRVHAADIAEADEPPAERAEVLERLYGWYRQTAEEAVRANNIQMPTAHRGALRAGPSDPVTFAAAGPAMAWLETERTNLCAAIRAAARRGLSAASWQLADAATGFFRLRPGDDDWSAAMAAALAAAAASEDAQAHASMLLSMADIETRRGDRVAALRQTRHALDVSRRGQWRIGEALALGALGRWQWAGGALDRSTSTVLRALAIHAELDDVAGQAQLYGRLGRIEHERGRLRLAAGNYLRALRMSEQAGSRLGRARAPAFLAQVTRDLGRFDEARAWCAGATDSSGAIGFPEGVAVALSCRAAIAGDLGAYASAAQESAQARATLPRVADPYIEIDCLLLLASAAVSLGDLAGAQRELASVRRIAHKIRNRPGAARAEVGLAAVHSRQGEHAAARRHVREARALTAGTRLIVVEAALNVLEAQAAFAEGAPARGAVAGYRRATALYREAGHRLGETRALLEWGVVESEAGRAAAAERVWRRALAIAEPLAVPEAEKLRVLLKGGVPA